MLKQLNIAPPAPGSTESLRGAARDCDGLVRAELTPALSLTVETRGMSEHVRGGRVSHDVTNTGRPGVTDTPHQTKTVDRGFLSGPGGGKETMSRHVYI